MMGYGEEGGGVSSSQSLVFNFKNLRRDYLLSPIKGSLKDGYDCKCKQYLKNFLIKKNRNETSSFMKLIRVKSNLVVVYPTGISQRPKIPGIIDPN